MNMDEKCLKKRQLEVGGVSQAYNLFLNFTAVN